MIVMVDVVMTCQLKLAVGIVNTSLLTYQIKVIG